MTQVTHHTVWGYTEFSLSPFLPLLSAGITASSLSSPSPHYTLPIQYTPSQIHTHHTHTHGGDLLLCNKTLRTQSDTSEMQQCVLWCRLTPLCPCLLCCWWWTGDYGYPCLAARIQAPGNSISNSINAASMTSPWRRLIGLRHCQHPSLSANERGEEGWGEGRQLFVLYCRVGGGVLLYGAGVWGCVCVCLCRCVRVCIRHARELSEVEWEIGEDW